MKVNKSVVAVLVSILCLGALPSSAVAQSAVVIQSDIENALAQRAGSDAANREAITTLLSRADVRDMAQGMGLDVRRAQQRVSSLQGVELRELANQATVADQMLSGGTTTVRISLVAVLLIIIIVILIAN